MLVLASASPRRQALLRQIGCAFRVEASRAREVSGARLLPEETALENARRKALETAGRVGRGDPVLGADTVVSVEAEILGKPRDAADAVRMLRLLSGRTHFVYTGVALVYAGTVYERVERTAVWMDALTEAELAAYVATGEPLDKAGAYAIQGRAARFIPKIEGSFSNVVGLPLHAVRLLAEQAGIAL